MADDVAARHQVELPAREEVGEALEILRRGDVDGDFVGEEVHVPEPSHGHAHDLPPPELGQGMLAPGEFVHGQVDLEAPGANLLHNALVAGGEGVEGAGEEGNRRLGRVGEGAQLHLALHQKAVEVVEHGGAVEAGEKIPALLGEQAQELFLKPQEVLPPHRKRNIGAGEDVPAQCGEGGLVDGILIVGDAGGEKPQSPIHRGRVVPHQG